MYLFPLEAASSAEIENKTQELFTFFTWIFPGLGDGLYLKTASELSKCV
jgi:hypothetical protein